MTKKIKEVFKYVRLTSIVSSSALITLISLLTSWDEFKDMFLNTQQSSMSKIGLLSIISIAVYFIVTLIDFICMYNELTEQKKRTETMIRYHKLTNKGDYNNYLKILYEEEKITYEDLMKLEHAYYIMTDNNNNYSEKVIEENLDDVYAILNNLAIEEQKSVS